MWLLPELSNFRHQLGHSVEDSNQHIFQVVCDKLEHGHLNAIEYEPKFIGKQQDYICSSIADVITPYVTPEVDDVDMHSLVENVHDEASYGLFLH